MIIKNEISKMILDESKQNEIICLALRLVVLNEVSRKWPLRYSAWWDYQ